MLLPAVTMIALPPPAPAFMPFSAASLASSASTSGP